MNLKTWISENTTAGLVEDLCSGSSNENLLAFHEAGMDEALDTTIKSRQGKQIMDADYVETPQDGIEAVEAYLIERSRYLAQVLEYFKAEYNPIENYSQNEHEEISTTYAERTDHGTDTKAEDTFRHGAHTDQQSFTQYSDIQINPSYTDTVTTGVGGYDVTTHLAKVETQTTPPGDTSTTSVAPFESDTFHNKEQTAVTHTQGSQTVARVAVGGDAGNDKVSYSQKQDTNLHGAHNDELQHGAHTDSMIYPTYDDMAHVGGTEDSYEHITDERTDSVERDLDRSGNIGVQTAAQMMQLDESFWWGFKPLQKMAREIAALLVEGVTVL